MRRARRNYQAENALAVETIARVSGVTVTLGERVGKTPWCYFVDVVDKEISLSGDLYPISKGPLSGEFSLALRTRCAWGNVREGSLVLMVTGSPEELGVKLRNNLAWMREQTNKEAGK